MGRKLLLIGLMAVLVLAVAVPALAGGNGRGSGPVIFVESQGLYFDSVVVADPVPNKGPFQELKTNGGFGTDFGPGDTGYVGGRWWMDTDGDGIQEDSDHFFVCPLLGPGRGTP